MSQNSTVTWRRSASALRGRFLRRTCFGGATGDGLQEPPAIAQGKAELFEIALA
jgi:hypothetical protein